MSVYWFCLSLALLPATLVASQCPLGNRVLDPEILVWTHHPGGSGAEEHWSAELEIGEAQLTIGGESLTTRVYRVPGTTGTIPGPTIVMQPGRKYVLRFSNTLPYEKPSPDHNVFKDPNISNLHTHGVHISGETPGDDVTRSFEGGNGGDFVYHIPADHMGGTYWYHAHHHGSTFLQVSGGAFGMLLIDDLFDPVPANVSAMAERQLVVAYLDPAAAGTGGDTLITGTLNPTWTVNGRVGGDLCTPPDTWQHWRILLADRDAKPKTLSVDGPCELALMARDGVWRTEVPRLLASNGISLTGASRADIAVRCSDDATLSVNGQAVADIFTDGTRDPSGHPFAQDGVSTWMSARPDYLRDLRTQPPDHYETINMGARTINGSKFDPDVPTFALPANGLQEWTLKGARNHPFHLHIYHVQVVGDCNEFEDGEYYDVVAGNCTIRFDLNAATSTVFEGRTIMHCHILEHEDQGAMGWAQVLQGYGAIRPPEFPPGMGYIADYSLLPGSDPPAAPSGLSATASSSSQIDLAWTDHSPDESGFHIERSSDGANFMFHGTVPADSTSYADTGLAPGSTWHYRVRAYNANGPSGYSNLASATTPSENATHLVVESVTVEAVMTGQGFRRGRAVVVIRDNLGNPVANASVEGEFSGDLIEVGLNGLTGADGSITIDSTETDKGNLALVFCLTGVTHASLNEVTTEVCAAN